MYIEVALMPEFAGYVTVYCWVSGYRLAEECSACCIVSGEEQPNTKAVTQQYSATSQKT